MDRFEKLREVVAALRGENGCPWDKIQTHASLRQYCIEESAELVCGIDIFEATGSSENMLEELGDVLFQVMLHAQIAEEEGLFTIDDVMDGITEKMISRHPHVFGGAHLDTPEEVVKNWGELKKGEGKSKELERQFLPAAFDESVGYIEKARERKCGKQ